MLPTSFFSDQLSDNVAAIPIRTEASIVARWDQRSVVACHGLEVEEFASLGHCQLKPAPQPRPLAEVFWGGEDCDRLYTQYRQVVWDVDWQGQGLQVVHLTWSTGCGNESCDWVVADTTKIAEAFILDVERRTHEPGEAILVFSSGHWSRSRSLYAATQSAAFEDLILADDLKATIREDFRQFLASEERYRRLGIAWRRGALLIGPPGNGKTHCVRALVKELGISSLYVQSLKTNYLTVEQSWQHVFERARGLHPCVLVLEDLDALVTGEDRSFFLNQLDGFERNHGLIVLATTNHPERIDPAIIDRPSRFDRKYHFPLPAQSERHAYLASWQAELEPETHWTSDEVDLIAEKTNGFSFAYLKELIISSVMTWMHDPVPPFATVLADQMNLLRKQMLTESTVG